MNIIFIGNFQGPGNNSGEEPDERHISRCLKQTGVRVTEAPRDEIHAFFTGAKKDNIPEPDNYDIILIAKWNHFTKEIIEGLRERYKGKVVYWVWDYMFSWHKGYYAPNTPWIPDWHRELLKNVDLYISGENNLNMELHNIDANLKHQYFNWDSSDGQYDALTERTEEYDVVFTGSFIPVSNLRLVGKQGKYEQYSYRNEMLKAVHDKFKLKIFSWDYEKWREEGFDAEPGQYGADFKNLSAKSKIMLCMNWIEPNKKTRGYWSNRIGKIATTGGLPLIHYVPGMERAFGDNVMYFYDKEDMFYNINWLLVNPIQRETQRIKTYDWGRREMSTQTRMKQFKILLESL